MKCAGLRVKLRAGEVLAGCFIKTPAHTLVEVLAGSGLDFACLDVEHSPIDRAAADACLAVARAADFPLLVRVARARPEYILQALDSGAVGVVVPHVTNAKMAAEVARAARFGSGGRSFAGSTRWAGHGGQPVADLLARSEAETVVIAQIEEPEGVEAVREIAATEGIDGLFLGPSDLSVALGRSDPWCDEVMHAYEVVAAAAHDHGKGMATFVPAVSRAPKLRRLGVSMFFVGSEHGFLVQGAREAGVGIHRLS